MCIYAFLRVYVYISIYITLLYIFIGKLGYLGYAISVLTDYQHLTLQLNPET